jgi:uncharacterized protein (DUF1330 family)
VSLLLESWRGSFVALVSIAVTNMKNWKIELYDSSSTDDTTEAEYHVSLEEIMPAYVIVDVEIIDAEKYEAYKKLVPASLEKYGGRFCVRGGRLENLEGDWRPQRFVILEFPSYQRAKAWWDSEEYAPAKAMRQQASRTQMILVEGLQ